MAKKTYIWQVKNNMAGRGDFQFATINTSKYYATKEDVEEIYGKDTAIMKYEFTGKMIND